MRMGVRVYYTDLERDYPEVYRDPTLLGAYVQLLALTDKAYPNDAVLPRDLRTSLVDRLVSRPTATPSRAIVSNEARGRLMPR